MPDPLLKVRNLPSYGIATVTRQPGRRMIHLLCYVPEKRGRQMEIIEEPSIAVDLEIALRIGQRPIKALYLAPGRKALPFTREGNYLHCQLERLIGYQMIVCEFNDKGIKRP